MLGSSGPELPQQPQEGVVGGLDPLVPGDQLDLLTSLLDQDGVGRVEGRDPLPGRRDPGRDLVALLTIGRGRDSRLVQPLPLLYASLPCGLSLPDLHVLQLQLDGQVHSHLHVGLA